VDRSYDGGKKIKGRKRHLLVDTQGTLLKNKVHPADIHDRAGAERFLEGLAHLFPAIELMSADTAYRGLKDWLQKALGWRLSIPQHWWSGGVWTRVGAEPPTRPSGFHVLARRWVVIALTIVPTAGLTGQSLSTAVLCVRRDAWAMVVAG
jgi:putative transposase